MGIVQFIHYRMVEAPNISGTIAHASWRKTMSEDMLSGKVQYCKHLLWTRKSPTVCQASQHSSVGQIKTFSYRYRQNSSF